MFCSHKFHKTEYYFIFDMLKKKIWPNFPRSIEVFTQKIVTKPSKIWVWDPESGIRKKPLPDPGAKNAPDPGSATLVPGHLTAWTLGLVNFYQRCSGFCPARDAGWSGWDCLNFGRILYNLFCSLHFLTLLHLPPLRFHCIGIVPKTVATSALAVRRSNHSARSHPIELDKISKDLNIVSKGYAVAGNATCLSAQKILP